MRLDSLLGNIRDINKFISLIVYIGHGLKSVNLVEISVPDIVWNDRGRSTCTISYFSAIYFIVSIDFRNLQDLL